MYPFYISFVKDRVDKGEIKIEYCPTEFINLEIFLKLGVDSQGGLKNSRNI